MNLAQACLFYKGSILHELMHSLGFFHEQSRGDRDMHVRVNWSNIVDDKESMFTNYGDFIDNYNMEYDYGSVMHYGAAVFAISLLYTVFGKVVQKLEPFNNILLSKRTILIPAILQSLHWTQKHSVQLAKDTDSHLWTKNT